MNHQSLKTCDRLLPSGKECDGQCTTWATSDSGIKGYWCTRCGAYRGSDGEQKGREIRRPQPKRP
jgi:hypothetical protein